jgi:hypothetical protein
MRTIRNSVFETNSSSCHVITVLSDYEMEQLKNGEVLLRFEKRQNEKVITQIIPEFRFEYELEQSDFCYDDDIELKCCNTDRKVMKALSKDLWKLLVENATKDITHAFDIKEDEIFAKYELDKDFKESVQWFIRDFADQYYVERLTSNMQKYEMPNGEIMNFSCCEVDC